MLVYQRVLFVDVISLDDDDDGDDDDDDDDEEEEEKEEEDHIAILSNRAEWTCWTQMALQGRVMYIYNKSICKIVLENTMMWNEVWFRKASDLVAWTKRYFISWSSTCPAAASSRAKNNWVESEVHQHVYTGNIYHISTIFSTSLTLLSAKKVRASIR